MTPPRDHAGPGVTIGLFLLFGVVTVELVLRAAGHIAATLQQLPTTSTPGHGGLAILRDPANPATALGQPDLQPWLFWTTATLLLIAVLGLLILTRQVAKPIPTHGTDPLRLPGTASRAQITRAAGTRTTRRKGRTLRPSLDRPAASDVGYFLGTARGRKVWATVEDSILLIGPPRSGKGLHIVINSILDAPGAVITTSTRPDNLTATLTARAARGPVAIFDPQQLAPGLHPGPRWSLLRGCNQPLTAMIRAAGLSASTGMNSGSVDNSSFWEGKTRTAIQALLHAAALDHQPPSTIYRWALNPASATDAVATIHTHPDAATGWADSLDATVNADPRTRDSIWQGVSLAFAPLADPRVLDAITPRAEDNHLDPETFLQEGGTLYLLATGTGASNAAPLVAALIEDIVETARTLGATAPGARLDPPLLLALDEIGNLAPLPSLPTLMAEGGGTGITTMPVLQSLAQARTRWGNHAATAIWDAAITKIILGGASNSRDLQDLTTLIGDHDHTVHTTTIDTRGGRSTQTATRRQPVMPPDTLRTLPFGTAITMLRTTPPIITRLRPWTDRRDAKHLTRQQSATQAALRQTAGQTHNHRADPTPRPSGQSQGSPRGDEP